MNMQRIRNFSCMIHPTVILSTLTAVILSVLLCVTAQVYAQTRTDRTAAVKPGVVATVVRPHPATPTSSSVAASVPTGTHAVVNTQVQTCVPIANDKPDSVDLTGAEGLVQRIDTPTFYQIYGTTPATLRSQIMRCAPKSDGASSAEYVANTSYNLTWRYSYTTQNGVCTITKVAVGVHVVQVLPLWFATANDQAGLPNSWATFTRNLKTHEDGHAGLDLQYAQQLMNDLRAFPPKPCAQLGQSVKLLIDNDVSELAQANDNYDSSTNHGATQGALLP